jgi:nucleotide-binding universal stress UspA family protein
MRTYLVVVDDSDEARLAQRFAARRAQRTGGNVHLVAVTEPSQFVAWGGVQATIEEEARQKAEAVVMAAANALAEAYGITPRVSVRQGDAAALVRQIIAEDSEIAALVLGSAAAGAPGPLVAHFTGHDAGTLPVTVMLVPGSLSEEAVDRLSE